MSERRWLSAAETARLVRKQLKVKFPGQKFYVRSSGAIRIYWQDGPTKVQVRAVSDVFEGEGFDGMIDMRYYKEHWLMPDGSVTLARSAGSVQSGGLDPVIENAPPHLDAELVSFGSSFVFQNRSPSPGFCELAAQAYKQETGWKIPELKIGDWWVGDGVKGETAYFADGGVVPGGMHYQTYGGAYNEAVANTAQGADGNLTRFTKHGEEIVYEVHG